MKNKINQEINKALKFENFPTNWSEKIMSVLIKLQNSELWEEIYLQSYLLDKNKVLSLKENVNLALANIYIWLAYSFYDKVLDDKKVSNLPMANILFSLALKKYYSLDKPSNWHTSLSKVFFLMEEANDWEINNIQQIKKFTKISCPSLHNHLNSSRFKSLAHCLPTLYLSCKENKNTAYLDNVISLFSSILLIRQIQDDLHDVEEDFKANRLNIAINFCLQISNKEIKNIDKLKNLLSLSQKNIIFLAQKENQKSKLIIKKTDFSNTDNYLQEIIKQQETEIETTLKNQKNIDLVINYFKK